MCIGLIVLLPFTPGPMQGAKRARKGPEYYLRRFSETRGQNVTIIKGTRKQFRRHMQAMQK